MNQRFVLLIAAICLASVFAAIGDSYVSLAQGPNQVLTSTVTLGSSYSTSLVSPQTIYSGPFTVLSTTGTNLPCEFWTANFNASTGQYVSGGFSSNIVLSFFVVPQASYQNWVKAGTCGNAADAIASEQLTTGYSFSPTAIPSSGTWTIVLVNTSNTNNADGTVNAYLSAGGYTVTQPFAGTITSTITAFTAGQITTISGFPFTSIIPGIVVGLAVIFLMRRQRGLR